MFELEHLPTFQRNIFRSFIARCICFSLAICIFLSSVKADAQPVKICRMHSMLSALLFIAEAKGFFKEQGLNPTFDKVTNAKICQDMILAGKSDYMAIADGPLTYLGSSNHPIKILAMIQTNPETSIFARRDRGVSSFPDLKGKRMAYLPGTISLFFLKRIMKQYDLRRADIQLTPMQPPTMAAALTGGAVDAISIWEPWGTQAILSAPDNIINLTAPEIYQAEVFFAGSEHAIRTQPEVPTKILKALIKSQTFIGENEEEAFKILSDAIVFEPTALRRLWKQYRHKVQLDEGPLKLLRDNFELLRDEDSTMKDVPIPNFRSYVIPTFLESIEEQRVRLND